MPEKSKLIYQVTRDGEPIGAFSREQLLILLKAGNLELTDYYWVEDMPEWLPLSCMVAIQEDSNVVDEASSAIDSSDASNPLKNLGRNSIIALILIALGTAWLACSVQEIGPWKPTIEEMLRRGVATMEDHPEKAMRWFRKAADAGNSEGQWRLGDCYARGKGVDQNDVEAVVWFRLAAEQGDPEAQWRLGRHYAKGEGVGESPGEALKWSQKSADQGNAGGQRLLGLCYYYGIGVPQNGKEAVKWLRNAADQGDSAAQLVLGECYMNGVGVDKNPTEGVKWYQIAANNDDAGAQVALGNCYRHGNGIEENIIEAVKWYGLAAEQGDSKGQYYMGICADHGLGVKKDKDQAAGWYHKSAAQGHASAQNNLGSYYKGFGERYYPEAIHWYRLAAQQNNAYAQCNLGDCYAEGHGVTKDTTEAIKWYQRSADQGHSWAMYRLAWCYQDAVGVVKDREEAFRWTRKAAYLGDAASQAMLGDFYAEGKVVPKDIVLAHSWFNLAKSGGYDGGVNFAIGYSIKIEDMIERLEEDMSPQELAEAGRLAKEYVSGQEVEEGPRPTSKEMAKFHAESSGTGFFIDSAGWLVTSAHVVNRSKRLKVVTKDRVYNATLKVTDSNHDLAVLKIDGTFPALPISNSHEIKMGATVLTVGFPMTGLMGFSPKLSKGEVAALSGIHDIKNLFQISVPVQPGNSGGALVDQRGNVVGVIKGKLSVAATLAIADTIPENVNYAIKAEHLLDLLNANPFLGINFKQQSTKQRSLEEIAKEAEAASVMVLAY